MRWRELNTVGKAVAVGIGLVTLGSSVSAGLWQLDARWVKRAEFQGFQAQVAQTNRELGKNLLDLQLELREGQLLNRRATLRGEQAVLEAAQRARADGLTPYERDRLRAITQELQDLERDLEAVQRQRRGG